MSDHEHPDDELVSADLDGEATAEESRRVARDPALRERQAAFEAVATRLADVPPPPAEQREEHLRVALAAADDRTGAAADDQTEADEGGGGAGTPPAPPVSLNAARRRRRVAVLSAAAALLVAFLGVTVIRATDDGGGDDTADLADAGTEPQLEALDPEVGEAADDGFEGAAGDEAPAADRDTASAPEILEEAAVVVDLGSFRSRAELEVAVTGAVDEYLAVESGYVVQGGRPPFTPSATAAVASTSPAGRCAAAVTRDDAEVTTLLWVGAAEFDGEPLTLLLFETAPDAAANGLLRLYAVTTAGCEPIAAGVQTFTP